MRIAVDAMGGDHAPKAVIDGVIKGIEAYDDLHITLVGDKTTIESNLTTTSDRITVLHADEVIEPTDEPVRAVRRKRTHLWFLWRRRLRKTELTPAFQQEIPVH